MTDNFQGKPKSYPILIVDDNRLQRSVLEANLKAAGYDVVAAENGKEALQLLKKRHYPIVMTDWIMPEMSGLDLCRAIRREITEGYTYLIILTSLDSKNDIIAGLEAGADEYLVKPVHQAELTARLKTARRILELENARDRYIEEIKSLSLIDPPTGVFNRYYMDEHIAQEIKRAYRYERSLSLILAGVNRFGEVVAQNGHYAGDVILKKIAECLNESIRKDVDWIARYGEDTFMVVLPETDTAGAMIVAKRLRLRIAAMSVMMHDREIRITPSFGVAGFTASQRKPGFTTDIFLEKVDKCLCQAREDSGETIKGVQIG